MCGSLFLLFLLPSNFLPPGMMSGGKAALLHLATDKHAGGEGGGTEQKTRKSQDSVTQLLRCVNLQNSSHVKKQKQTKAKTKQKNPKPQNLKTET
jgi:hypothetical protein